MGCSANLPQMGEITKAGTLGPGEAAVPDADGAADATGQTAATAPVTADQAVLPAEAATATERSAAIPVSTAPASSLAPTPAALPSTAGTQIAGFKGKTVILYSSPTSNDGQRVPTSSLPLPLTFRASPDNATRVGVLTLEGVRWIARSDITLAASTAVQVRVP